MKKGIISLFVTLLSLIFICTNAYPTSNEGSQSSTKSTKHAKSKSKSVDKSEKSSFPQQRDATGKSVFIFDPNIHQWAVYGESGQLIRTGRGSGGRDYCPDIHRACHTPVGVFSVYAQEGPKCKSRKFPVGKGGAPMPYCSYFHGGFAVHGSYEVRSYNASHGCIRIYPEDAKWLQSVIYPGSTVIVKPY